MAGVAAVLVAAVVAARARAQHEKPHVPGMVAHLVFEVVDTVAIVLLVTGLLIMITGRRAQLMRPKGARKKRKKGLTQKERTRIWVALAVGMAIALVYDLLTGGDPNRQDQAPPDDSTPKSTNVRDDPFATPQGAHGQGGNPLASYLTVIASVIALAVLLWVLMRRYQADDEDELEADEEPEPETVVAAVAAGRAAVRDPAVTDPREAIVACFAAMERAMAGAGGAVAPTRADTPAEVLRRGLEHAAFPDRPGRTLLRLFREARFSDHPMTQDHRDAADQALQEILDGAEAHLGGVR